MESRISCQASFKNTWGPSWGPVGSKLWELVEISVPYKRGINFERGVPVGSSGVHSASPWKFKVLLEVSFSSTAFGTTSTTRLPKSFASRV